MWRTTIDRSFLVPALALVMLVGCGTAEETPPPAEDVQSGMPVPAEPMPTTATPTTLTGCLSSTNGDYALVVTEAAGDVAQGARYQVTPQAGVDLTGHVGHTVRLTGTTDAAPMTLAVTSMQHVSAECQPPTGQTP